MKNKIRAISVAIGEIGGAKRTAIRDGAYPFISNEVSEYAGALGRARRSLPTYPSPGKRC